MRKGLLDRSSSLAVVMMLGLAGCTVGVAGDPADDALVDEAGGDGGPSIDPSDDGGTGRPDAAPTETGAGDTNVGGDTRVEPSSDAAVDSATDSAPTGTCPDWHCSTGCADIVAMPGSFDPASAQAKKDGYYIGTLKKYAYLRKHITLVIAWSACEVARRHPGTMPLAIQDMTQVDGKTPGTDVGSPRHPTTTHTGSDVDISYYQTDGDNDVQIVCGDGSDTNSNGRPGKYNDGYFCTTEKNIVDWAREVWFFAKMADTTRVRVFGIDQTMPAKFTSGADALYKAGDISAGVKSRMTILGYGSSGGWQFHHHHTHMSYSLP
jgi:hypothetical protein